MEKPALLSPLTLAFIGDGVYELLVREHLAAKGSMPAGKLHKMAVELVRASAQAGLYNKLEEENLLTEQEFAVMKRGRNNNSCHCPKNADPIEYRKATGIEALFGYLYLERQMARLDELFRLALELWGCNNFRE